MSDTNGSPPPSTQRRKSFVEMLKPRTFSHNPSSTSNSNSPSNPIPVSPGVPGGRKSSISMALGLSGSNGGQESAYTSFARQRRASISTSPDSGTPEFRNSFDEGAVIDDDDKVGPMNSPPSPTFARRLSFGAQAMRDVRQGGTSPSNNAGEGFNWSDAMRDRNKRNSVNSGTSFGHNRSKSFNAPGQEPPKEMPKQPAPPPGASTSLKKPDHLGERMLRGEFMMD